MSTLIPAGTMINPSYSDKITNNCKMKLAAIFLKLLRQLMGVLMNKTIFQWNAPKASWIILIRDGQFLVQVRLLSE